MNYSKLDPDQRRKVLRKLRAMQTDMTIHKLTHAYGCKRANRIQLGLCALAVYVETLEPLREYSGYSRRPARLALYEHWSDIYRCKGND